VRALPAGTIEAFGSTFLLLIALRHFDLSTGWKGAIGAAQQIGLLVAPAAITWAGRRGFTAGQAITRLLAIGAFGALAPLLHPTPLTFVFGCLVAFTATGAQWGLLQTIYADRFPAERRGRMVSITIAAKFAFSGVIAYGVGRLLGKDASTWKWAQAMLLASVVASALCFRLIGGPQLEPVPLVDGAQRERPWVRRWALLRTDRTLRATLTSWMFMGFANLMMIPLRVEFLANPRYGIDAPSATIGVLTITIPAVMRLVLAPVYGWVFDHLPFFVARILVNVGFALSIVVFFAGKTMAGLVAGAVVFGISAAGGDVMWSLWTSRLAPPEHVADYSALHTFTTGIRGVIAPFVGLWLLAHDASPRAVGVGCALLILVGSLILIPDLRAERSRLAHARGLAAS
jgi:MFS family permease